MEAAAADSLAAVVSGSDIGKVETSVDLKPKMFYHILRWSQAGLVGQQAAVGMATSLVDHSIMAVVVVVAEAAAAVANHN